jgi:hypothetical protein
MSHSLERSSPTGIPFRTCSASLGAIYILGSEVGALSPNPHKGARITLLKRREPKWDKRGKV